MVVSTESVRHDAGKLRMSSLLEVLEQYWYSSTGQPLCIYGDLAYPIRVQLQLPYRGARLSNDEQFFNASMSTVRTAVELGFGDITSYFAFLDFKRNLKIGLSPVCALLRNAITCLYGFSTGSYFDVQPPTLEEYFQVCRNLQFILRSASKEIK